MADITKLQIGNDELDITKKQDKMAILSYGHSTWSDFIDVYQKNAVVYCRASSNSNPATGSQTRMAFMAYVNNAENPTEVEFQYVRSVSSKTASQPVDQVFVYKLTNASGGTWTVQTRNMAPKLAAGTGASVTYSNGTYTVNATEVPVPTKTSDLTNDGSDGTSTYVESDELATVATTGSYEDLSDKPTIPAAQVNSDWNSSSGVSQILNKPTLSTVATSGSYDDLTNKPTIPTVNNATLTIQKNGTTVETFTANSSSNKTANISVPTKTSDLTNDGSAGTDTYVESSALSDVAISGDYNDLENKPTIPTVGSGILTIQKNSSNIDTFSANATANKTINITVPTTAADVSALPASTKYGSSISVSINSADYKITTTLKDQDGNTLGTAQVIDLPLESVVVNGSFDSVNKKIVLTLENGNTVDIPVGDLVAGLQTEITSSSKLASDLVDDTGQTNKFMTSAEKTKLSGIAAGAEVNVQSDWNQTTTTADDYIKNKPTLAAVATSGSYEDLSNKPTIPTVNNATLTIQKNGTTVKTFTANASTNVTANIIVPTKTSDITNDSNFVASGDLATVATSGSYNDLTNKPTVPEIKKRTGATTTTNITPLYVAGDGTTTTPMALKTHGDSHFGSFAYVNINEPTNDISEAYIGGYVWDEYEEWWRKMSEKKLALYSDIPTVNNGTLTIQKNGTNVQTFTANQSSNVTANISVPTKTSDITNDSNFVVDSSYVHTDNNYTTTEKTKLSGIEAGAEVNVQPDWDQTTTTADDYIKNKPALATVATSGSYNDLSNKPTVDSSLSFSSTNAVENQAIKNAIYDKNSSNDKEAGVNVEFSNPTLNPYVHIGSKSSATKGNSSVGIGYNAESSAVRSVAIGPSATVTKREGVALGANATAGQYSLSIGYYTNTVPNYSTAVGPYAKVLTDATNATAIGYQSEADEAETISVGKSTNRRRIVNVADGTTATDAATVGQIPVVITDEEIDSIVESS